MTQEQAQKQRELENKLRKELDLPLIEETVAIAKAERMVKDFFDKKEKELLTLKSTIEDELLELNKVRLTMGITPNIPVKMPVLTKRGLKK
jgi:hypothetical protein